MRGWDELVDHLKGHQDIIAEAVGPVDDQRTAELQRQFAMNLAQGYFLHFHADPDFPEFVPFENSAFLLQPNPDAVYYYARVEGTGAYRVTGERGNAPVVGFAIGNRIIGMSDQPGKGFANYDLDQLSLDADGAFEVIFSSERPEGHEGNWLYLHPEADFILVRQFSYDWGRERDMRLAIERVDRAASYRPRMSADDVQTRLLDLFAYARRLSRVGLGALRRPYDQGHVNRMHLHDFQDLGNSADWPQAYFETVFDLAGDEALLIECELPSQAHYWNMQVVDSLWNQIDVPYCQSSLNGRTARVGGDRSLVAVLAGQDPGFANWLDTGGHGFGMVIGRWYRCSSHPTPQVRKVKFTELPDLLDGRTPRITPEDRASDMRERLIGSQLRRKW